VVPPEVPQTFLPLSAAPPPGATLIWRPLLVGAARVRLADAKLKLDQSRDVVAVVDLHDEAVPVRWDEARRTELAPSELGREPAAATGVTVRWADPPSAALRPKSYAGWSHDLQAWLTANESATLWRCERLRETSLPGESERDFRVRLGQLAREERDRQVDKLEQRYAGKLATLRERERRAEQAVARESEQVSQQRMETYLSVGETLLGSLLGRRAVSQRAVRGAASAARHMGRAMKEGRDVGRAQDTVAAIAAQIDDLEAQLQEEVKALDTRVDVAAEPLEEVTVRPKKTGVSVQLLALGWAPFWLDAQGALVAAWEAP
jgi:hypothetical protein